MYLFFKYIILFLFFLKAVFVNISQRRHTYYQTVLMTTYKSGLRSQHPTKSTNKTNKPEKKWTEGKNLNKIFPQKWNFSWISGREKNKNWSKLSPKNENLSWISARKKKKIDQNLPFFFFQKLQNLLGKKNTEQDIDNNS